MALVGRTHAKFGRIEKSARALHKDAVYTREQRKKSGVGRGGFVRIPLFSVVNGLHLEFTKPQMAGHTCEGLFSFS